MTGAPAAHADGLNSLPSHLVAHAALVDLVNEGGRLRLAGRKGPQVCGEALMRPLQQATQKLVRVLLPARSQAVE